MAEIERIIEQGVLPEGFFREEERCGFHVTENRKKIWAIEIDLYLAFVRVCEKYGLRFWAEGGTLLGAVRHRGFIPWDDDFDVLMPREDYEVFIHLEKEFEYPYFLQTPYTDPGSCYSYAKIRNSNTTGLVELFKYQNFNHGIWITVFPLDRWDLEGGEERYMRIRKLATDCSTYMRMKNPNLSPKDIERVKAYKGNPILDYEEIHRLASFCKDPNSKYVMNAAITLAQYDKKLLDSADFSSTVPLEFEGVKLLAPIGYDHLLHIWFGNYLEFPPIEERGLWHADVLFDADIPYKDYLFSQGISI